MATARLQYDDTSLDRSVRPQLTLVSDREETVTEISSTDAAVFFDFPREIKMSQRDFKLFLVALESDEEPSDKLKSVFKD